MDKKETLENSLFYLNKIVNNLLEMVNARNNTKSVNKEKFNSAPTKKQKNTYETIL